MQQLSQVCFTTVGNKQVLIDLKYIHKSKQYNGIFYSTITPEEYETIKQNPNFVEDTKIIELMSQNGINYSRDPFVDSVMFNICKPEIFNLFSGWLVNLSIVCECKISRDYNLYNLRNLTIYKPVIIRSANLTPQSITCFNSFSWSNNGNCDLIIKTNKPIHVNHPVDKLSLWVFDYRIQFYSIKCNTLELYTNAVISPGISFNTVVFYYMPCHIIPKIKVFISHSLPYYPVGFDIEPYDNGRFKYTRISDSQLVVPISHRINYKDLRNANYDFATNDQLPPTDPLLKLMFSINETHDQAVKLPDIIAKVLAKKKSNHVKRIAYAITSLL